MSLNLGDILFTLAAFIVLMLLLKKVALKPLMKNMNERQEKIHSDIDTAQENLKKTEENLNISQKQVNDAKKEINILRENNKEELKLEREEARNKTQKELSLIKENALNDIEKDKKLMIEEVKEEVVQISINLAETILTSEINEEKQKELIKKGLKNE